MIFALVTNALAWIKRLPPAAWYAAAGLALIVGFLIWNHFDNKAAIEADRRATEAKVARQTLEAERAANAADAARQAENQANDNATRKAMDDAIRNNPDAARSAAGPATRAVADSLRNRQASTGTAAR